MWHKVISKWRKPALNSEFSFSKTVYQTKSKEPNLPSNLTRAEKDQLKRKQTHPGFEIRSTTSIYNDDNRYAK